VTYEGNESFRSDSMGEGFESAAKVVDGGYVVEMKIPFRVIEPEVGTIISFDVQINDAAADRGRLLTTWSDPKANGYNTTENWGELTLIGPEEPGQEPGPSPSPGPGSAPTAPSEPTIDTTDGIVTITPAVQVRDGVATTSVSSNILNQALEQAESNAAGKKQITVEIPAQSDVTSYEVELPLANLTDADDTVISIKTEQGVIELPGNMLANMGIESTDKITVRIAQAATDHLSDEIRAQIGDRPVISLEVLVGDSIVEWNNPDAPVTVSVPYTPTAEELANPDAIVIWYIDGQGRVTVVKNGRYDPASDTVIFKTTHFSDFAVVYNHKTFSDLAGVPWAKQAIEAMAARGIINGTSATSYTPTAAIQRADFVLLLVSLLELEDTGVPVAAFDDVSSSAYYAEAVKIARQHGIVQGKGNNLFGPTEFISRQDMMVMVMRALKAAGLDLAASGSLSRFSDAALVADYARDSAAALAGAGIVQGSGNKLNPQGTLTRAEAAVVLYRLWSRL
jgi:endo-1,4-beta-xylanase